LSIWEVSLVQVVHKMLTQSHFTTFSDIKSKHFPNV